MCMYVCMFIYGGTVYMWGNMYMEGYMDLYVCMWGVCLYGGCHKEGFWLCETYICISEGVHIY